MIGAGSVVFTRNILGDVLSYPELQEVTFALHDIDPVRLETAEMMARWTAKSLGVASCQVEAHLERRKALEGADYVLNMIQVGMHESTLLDFNIPRKYGLQQTIADTLGVGGVFRALRTIPVLLDICRDMEELCPEAWLLNYTNPMSMLMWTAYKATKVNVVGLCHSVQGTTWQLANYVGVPFHEVTFLGGGINHQNWILRFERDGEDLYPRLRDAMKDPDIYAADAVRFEIFRWMGRFPTESSEHNAEYVPYFIQHEDLIERLHIPIDEYIRRSERNLQAFEETRRRLAAGESFPVHRSSEYAAEIIYAMETGEPRVIYGNVENRGLIPNLPQGCCVEVPCLVDRTGLWPTCIGEIPPQCAALNRSCVNVQDLTVRAALEGNREHVYRAVMMDPHASSILTLDQIWSMTDEMIEAHGDALPEGITRSRSV